MKAKQPKILEANVKKAVYKYLSVKGYFWWPSKTVGVWSKKKQCYLKDPWLKKGISDIMLLKGGVLYALELKGSETPWSKEQQQFEYDISSEGGQYYIIRSIDDLQEIGL